MQRLFEKPFVEFRDDALLACSVGHALGADADVPVEVVEFGGLLFQSSRSASVSMVPCMARDTGLCLGEGVVGEKRVENWLGDQVLGQHPYGVVLSNVVVEVVADTGDESWSNVSRTVVVGPVRAGRECVLRDDLGNLANGPCPFFPVVGVRAYLSTILASMASRHSGAAEI